MEINGNFEFEVMYHKFSDLTKITEELEWLMNLETPLSYQLITSIRIYELQNERCSVITPTNNKQVNKIYTFHNVKTYEYG